MKNNNSQRHCESVLTISFLIFLFIGIAHAASETQTKLHRVEPAKDYEVQTARDLAYWKYPAYARFDLGGFSTEQRDEIKELAQRTRPFYSGIWRELALSSYNWFRVKRDGGFDVWQVHIHSPRAVSLQVHFTNFNLQHGMSVNVYSYDKSDTYIKEYTGQGWTGTGEFWSQQVAGDTIVVEFWSPTSRGLSFSQFPFSITGVSHTFRDTDGTVQGVSFQPAELLPNHGACPLRTDVCSYLSDIRITTTAGDTLSLRRSVSMYQVINQNMRTTQCTGNLLNTLKKDDSTLYLLTAWHCLEKVFANDPDPKEDIPKGSLITGTFRFHVTDSGCGDTIRSADNARFIAGDRIGDYALLRIEPVRTSLGIVFLGVQSTPLSIAAANEVRMLHHANGTNQNYSRYKINGLGLVTNHDVPCPNDPTDSCFDTQPCQGNGCSHYTAHAVVGGITGGASGAVAMRNDAEARAVGVLSYGDGCDVGLSRVSKMYEDGRFLGAIRYGDDYYRGTGSAANFDDGARPIYDTPSSGGGSGGGGGGGGAIELWFLLLLLPLLMFARLTRK